MDPALFSVHALNNSRFVEFPHSCFLFFAAFDGDVPRGNASENLTRKLSRALECRIEKFSQRTIIRFDSNVRKTIQSMSLRNSMKESPHVNRKSNQSVLQMVLEQNSVFVTGL
jgi:hypothetical protein